MSEVHFSPLGKPVSYQTEYDPGLLFPVARLNKREEIGLSTSLPFMGMDIWNAYELSWLNPRGKPQVALASFMFSADSPNIIESKSFKLYLNSFNQTRLQHSDELKDRLARDLSLASGCPVLVEISDATRFGNQRFAELDGYCIDNLDIAVDTYTPAPQLLCCDANPTPIEETLVSNLLKSNCLVTGQPDWASVQIRYLGQAINRESLLRYLISFREHNEFHEQCVERIFVDIMRACQPMKLAVYARYTRRGGLDINPWRSNYSAPLPPNLRTARQ